ncbi:hypothetical protein [Streptomyces iconiensis]|uniref:Uncharacterized protein n=1 Tax=Streptomyces iconiensis TaxID=1384038 RepID=A0ABT6ZXI0_9ACTN|nr:hypothetical protein [Streptomyces iconiensis]MDJ1133772.1 hypothetical protein [Streptomyces iconiensis]
MGQPVVAAPRSPAGLFLARTVKGDWAGAARVAVWPLGLLFVAACALGIYSNEDMDDLEIGWGTRMRVALAGLLQGVGGGFGVVSDGSVDIAGDRVAGVASLSWVPLLATLAWVAALALAARGARGRLRETGPSAGFEAALRVAALCAGGACALGLYARPSYEGMEVSSSPGLTLLWAFLLSTVVAGVVLTRGTTEAWLAARPTPGPRIALGALRTALVALTYVLALASAVMLVVLLTAPEDRPGGQELLGLLVLLPNIGALGLGIAWGAPLDGHFHGTGLTSESETFGYGQLAEAGGGWAVFGALAGGLVCALILGVLAARRSADRREHFLAAALFVLLVLTLVALAGASVEADFREVVETGGFGGTEGAETFTMNGRLGVAGAEMLLFTLLWSFGGAFAGPYLLRLLRLPMGGVGPGGPVGGGSGLGGGAGSHAGAAMGTQLDVPAQGAQPGGPHGVTSGGSGGGGVAPPPSRGPALKWAGLILAAFLVGGAATGGVLLLVQDGDGGKESAAKGSVQEAETEAEGDGKKPEERRPSDGRSSSPGSSASPTGPTDSGKDGPSVTPSAAGLPEGFVMVEDPEGFGVGVMDGWQRVTKGTQIDYEAPTGGDYLRIGIIEDAKVSSYDNFRTLEKQARKRDDYDRIELKENTFQGRPGARWEFTYTSDDSGNAIHAIDQAYVAEDGTEYSIYAESRAFPGDKGENPVFTTAVKTWREPRPEL